MNTHTCYIGTPYDDISQDHVTVGHGMMRRCALHTARFTPLRIAQPVSRLSTKAVHDTQSHLEMGIVLDRYQPTGRSWFKGWTDFSVSTLAVVTLRKDIEGWAVPKFKAEAAQIYKDVGKALAMGDKAALKSLTTPTCYAQMEPSLRSRPAGQRQKWKVLECNASVVQVRVGHHQSNPGRRFAQATCKIDASLVWTITDRKGAIVGGLGTASEPFKETDVWWVFERCISMPAEPPAWRLKEQIRLEKPDESGT